MRHWPVVTEREWLCCVITQLNSGGHLSGWPDRSIDWSTLGDDSFPFPLPFFLFTFSRSFCVLVVVFPFFSVTAPTAQTHRHLSLHWLPLKTSFSVSVSVFLSLPPPSLQGFEVVNVADGSWEVFGCPLFFSSRLLLFAFAALSFYPIDVAIVFPSPLFLFEHLNQASQSAMAGCGNQADRIVVVVYMWRWQWRWSHSKDGLIALISLFVCPSHSLLLGSFTGGISFSFIFVLSCRLVMIL